MVFLDPVEPDLIDPAGRRLTYDVEAGEVTAELSGAFISVAGNVELLVVPVFATTAVTVDGAVARFVLNVDHVQGTSRLGAVVVDADGTRQQSYTEAMRGGQREFVIELKRHSGFVEPAIDAAADPTPGQLRLSHQIGRLAMTGVLGSEAVVGTGGGQHQPSSRANADAAGATAPDRQRPASGIGSGASGWRLVFAEGPRPKPAAWWNLLRSLVQRLFAPQPHGDQALPRTKTPAPPDVPQPAAPPDDAVRQSESPGGNGSEPTGQSVAPHGADGPAFGHLTGILASAAWALEKVQRLNRRPRRVRTWASPFFYWA